MSGLKIGILTHNYPLRSKESKDAGKFIFSFAGELAKRNEVFVLCPNYKEKKENYRNPKVTWFEWGGGEDKLGDWSFFDPVTPWKFFRLLIHGCRATLTFVKKNKIDVILSFWNFPSGVFAMYAKKRLGIPYMTWALGSDIYVYPKFPIVRQLTQLVLKNSDKTFGNSYDICRHIRRLSSVKAEFLPTSNLITSSEYKKPPLKKNRFNFLSICRLEKVKGPDVLLEASKILSGKVKNFTVTFIGGGSMQSELVDKAKNYQIEDSVKMLGYVENQSLVNGYLKESDCLVIPSRSESFPLVVTEALQVGLPMIGSDVGDMPAFIGKNKLGFIFPREDSKALASAMGKMIKQGRKIRKGKKGLMENLAREFRLSSIINKFLSLL